MLQTPWSLYHIKQCEKRSGQAMLRDEHTLVSFSDDFGKLTHSKPSAVVVPQTIDALAKVIRYANDYALPITIRANGMSQCGQSLPLIGGVTVHMQQLNKVDKPAGKSIWLEANATWGACLELSLQQSLAPFVVPYNCNLSIAGVLSAGGIGASSFKYGTTTAHVDALEVLSADGEIHRVDANSPLFHACLGGQGRFGVITKASILLRPCAKNVRTFFLVYLEKEPWLADLDEFKKSVDYIELFCSPSLQGAKLTEKGRLPFAQWLYAMHVSVEYEDLPPTLTTLGTSIRAWKTLHIQDESIESYMHRHDSRFNAMKVSGQWDLQHPWYECLVPAALLIESIDELLASLPIYYASILQIVPIKNLQPRGFLMLPDASDILEIMILNPGLPEALIPGCLNTIQALDDKFLKRGGKRYLSGFLGRDLTTEYWKNHFNSHYKDWIELKKCFDPKNIFCSFLHHN